MTVGVAKEASGASHLTRLRLLASRSLPRPTGSRDLVLLDGKFKVMGRKGELAGWLNLTVTQGTTTESVQSQVAKATVKPTPLPKVPTPPDEVVELGKAFGSLLSNINGVMELMDQLSEVKCIRHVVNSWP
jgi:hypothetical protein